MVIFGRFYNSWFAKLLKLSICQTLNFSLVKVSWMYRETRFVKIYRFHWSKNRGNFVKITCQIRSFRRSLNRENIKWINWSNLSFTTVNQSWNFWFFFSNLSFSKIKGLWKCWVNQLEKFFLEKRIVKISGNSIGQFLHMTKYRQNVESINFSKFYCYH